MLHKIRFFALDLALFLFAQVPLASAAVVTSMKPLGFIAAAIADGVTETRCCCPMAPPSMIIPSVLLM